MSVVGFDGKVRRKPPADWAWLITSCLLTAAFWLVCFYPLGRESLIRALMPFDKYPVWPGLVCVLVPYVLTLALSFVFRVPYGSYGARYLLFWAGAAAVFLGTGIAVWLMSILDWYRF
jgi:hypothetical protein